MRCLIALSIYNLNKKMSIHVRVYVQAFIAMNAFCGARWRSGF